MELITMCKLYFLLEQFTIGKTVSRTYDFKLKTSYYYSGTNMDIANFMQFQVLENDSTTQAV